MYTLTLFTGLADYIQSNFLRVLCVENVKIVLNDLKIHLSGLAMHKKTVFTEDCFISNKLCIMILKVVDRKWICDVGNHYFFKRWISLKEVDSLEEKENPTFPET